VAGRLAGKVALVSGGARGMGASHVRTMVGEGARVVFGDILDDEGKAVAAELGDAVRYVHLDVTKPEEWDAAVSTAIGEFGGIDVLVNNAQQVPTGPLDECTDDDMYTAWESGALAAFRLMQLCHPHMKARGGGAIVNLGSGAGTEGLAGLGAYAVAKEGIRALTKVAMLEWGADNIRVNTICPWARTDHWDGLADRQRAARLAHNPLRRIGDPEADVGAVVVFLAGDAGSYVTGQTIHVDGGNMGFR
jgi:3alpha(or 20beta)-hydroxysteroid dehydrogenase